MALITPAHRSALLHEAALLEPPPIRDGQPAAVEKRQFGRRQTCLHAWVLRDGYPRLACVVRNVSEGGALLEFPVPGAMPYWFTLSIDCKGFEARCEIRHQGVEWMGVRFVSIERMSAPIAAWSPLLDDTWTGTGSVGKPKPR